MSQRDDAPGAHYPEGTRAQRAPTAEPLRSFMLFAVRRSGRTGTLRLEAVTGWLLIAVAFAFMAWRTQGDPRNPFGQDLSNIFGGAVCMVHGCSPYHSADMQRVLDQHGYFHYIPRIWSMGLPLYPPFTLALFTPFEHLRFGAVAVGFYWFSLAVWMGAIFQVFIRCRGIGDSLARRMALWSPVLRGGLIAIMLVTPDLHRAMIGDNPVLAVCGLLLFCSFDCKPERRWWRAGAFALAFLLKPQAALFLAIPLLFKRSDGWPTLWRSALIAGPVVAGSLLWCAAHPVLASWRSDIRANLAIGMAPGNTMDITEHKYIFDTRLNLSYLLGYWCKNVALDTEIAIAVTLVLTALAIWAAWRLTRGQGQRRSVFSATTSGADAISLVVAATAALTLLPVYHRAYDAILLFLALPWAMAATAGARKFSAGRILLAAALLVVPRWRLPPGRFTGVDLIEQPATTLGGFIGHRDRSIVVLAVALLLVGILLRHALVNDVAQREPV